jgi:hypothetical protein
MPLPPSSPGGTKVAVLATDGVHVLDAGTRRTFAPLCPPAFPLAFEGEDSLLVIRGVPYLENSRIAPLPEILPRPLLDWWDLRTNTRVETEIRGLEGKDITSVAVSPDRSVLALAWRAEGKAAGVAFVDSHSGALRRSVDKSPDMIATLEFAPDGRSLAVVKSGGRLELIAYPSGRNREGVVFTGWQTAGGGCRLRHPFVAGGGW